MVTANVDALLSASFGPDLLTWTARSLHRSGLQNKELDSAIGVRSPRFGTGEKGYLYLYMYIIAYQYNKVSWVSF